LPGNGALHESKELFNFVMEQASEIILLYDLDTKSLLEGNLAFHKLLGYSIEDIAELSIYDIEAYNRDSIDSNIEKAKKKKQCFIGQRKYRKKDGALLDVEVSVNLFFVEGKGILCSIARDITERTLAEEAFSKSEQEKKAILNGLKTIGVEYLDTQMRIVWLNRNLLNHFNLSADEIKGKRCFEALHGLESPCPGCTAFNALQTGESQEGTLITPEGKIYTSHSNLTKDASGDLAGVVRVAINITDRERAERALQESENKYKAIFENTGTVMIIIEDDTTISLANSKFGKLIGYDREEIEGKRSWTEFVVKEDLEWMLEQHKLRRIDPSAAMKSYEFQMMDRNGNTKHILLNCDIIPGTKKSVASMLDITERKQIEEDLRKSEEKYKTLAESSQDVIFVIDRNDKIEYVNSFAAKSLGRQPEEIIGRYRYSFFPPAIADLQKQHLTKVFDTGVQSRNEGVIIVDGTKIWQDTELIPLKANNKTFAVLGISRDITERKRSEEMLRASLVEKELLLKEIHHRVKNNLGIISALLSLQSSYIADEDIIKVFRDGRDRIKSMALVHENLYRSKDFDNVDFDEYINQLVSYLSQSYGDLAGKISFKVHSENVYLNINTAIPCGMIINELVSNSIKHAFPDGRNGEICICLRSENDGFKLAVNDNGVGIKDGLNIKDPKTLGFRLIDALIKQIDGKMSIDTTNGTRCEIWFKGLK